MSIFHFLKRPRIAVQLLTWFLTISLLPLAAVTLIVYGRSKHSLEHEVTQDLLAVAQRQSKQIISYIRERERNVTTLSRTPDIIRAMKTFDDAFKKGGLFSTRYMKADRNLRPFLTYYQESSNYDDLYLFSSDGDAIFSVTQGEDLGSNFTTGIYRETGLAEVFNRASTMLGTEISDFAYYPVTNEPAAFIAAPILDKGLIIGVVALQMNNEAIYEIINDYTGLGRTGETVIASMLEDRAVFQAPSRHDPYAAFRKKVELGSNRDPAVENSVRGRKGSGITTDYRNKEVLAVWKYTPDMRWGMVTKLDLDEAFAPIDQLRVVSLWVSLVTLVMVVVSAFFVARSISNPIRKLTWRTKRVAEGDLTQHIEVATRNEIGDLARSFNEMTEGLRERNFIKETFGKYLSKEIRDEVLSGRIPLDGEFREVTVMFADLRGFTTMTERNDPKIIVTVMNSYFEAMAEAIQAEGGLILQFLGDEIYAVFGAPVRRADHPVRAFRAALEMSACLSKLNERLFAQGKPTLRHGIGLHTGRVVAANIGSPDRLSYLLVGDAVNLASRLQGLTKEHSVEIILSEETLSRLPETELGRVEVMALGATQVRGKSLAVNIFAVISSAKATPSA